jgi:MFS family permease
LISSCLWFFGEGLLGPLFSVYAEKIGGDMLDITWAWGAYLIATGVFYFLVGKWIEKSRYKMEVMVIGYALNALLTFCYLWVHSTMQLFIIQVGLGIAEALSTPVWETLFATNIDDDDNSFYWSLATGHGHLMSGIAIVIGGLIADLISFRALFITMGLIQVAATIIQFRVLRHKNLIVSAEAPFNQPLT